jgi:hypothetical protein
MRVSMVLLAPVLGIALAATAAAPEPASAATPTPTPTPIVGPPAGVFSGSVDVTNVSVLIRATDENGRPVTNLKADEVEVREDGVPAVGIAIDPFVPEGEGAAPAAQRAPAAGSATSSAGSPAPRVTIYVQADLLDRGQIEWALKGLKGEAKRLVGLGPVSVVVADPKPAVEATGIATPEALDRELERLLKHVHYDTSMERTRRLFSQDAGGTSKGIRRLVALNAFREEMIRVKSSVSRLRAWNAAGGRRGGRVLMLVSGGFDLDPWAHYEGVLDDQTQTGDFSPDSESVSRTPSSLERRRLDDLWRDVSQELVRNGWTVLSFSGGMSRLASLIEAPDYFLEPLRRVARDSGGALVVTPNGLGEELASMGSAYVLSFTMNRPPDAKTHNLQVVVDRAGVKVQAPTVTRTAPRREGDLGRAFALLSGGGSGRFPVEVDVKDVTGSRRKGYAGKLVVTGHLAEVLPLLLSSRAPAMEVTVAVDTDKDAYLPFSYQGHPMPLRLADSQGTWIYESPVQWPADARAVAVVVSETTTDTWGGAVTKLR